MRNLKNLLPKLAWVVLTLFSVDSFSQSAPKGVALRDKNLHFILEDEGNIFYVITTSIKPIKNTGTDISFDVRRDYKIANKDHPEDVGLNEHFTVNCDKKVISQPLTQHLRGDGMIGKLDSYDFNKGMSAPDNGSYEKAAMSYACATQFEQKSKRGATVAESKKDPINIDLKNLKIVLSPDANAYYPKFSRNAGEQGVAVVRLIVDDAGVVEEVGILQSTTFPRLDRAAHDIGMAYRFQPFTVNGIPQRFTTNILIKFALP